MGKDKESVVTALLYIVKIVDVVAVIVPSDRNGDLWVENTTSISSIFNSLYPTACLLNIPVYNSVDIYKAINEIKDVDLVVSFLFPKKIKYPLIRLPKIGCINFHSAPLPKYRGWGVYNAAILNNEKQWGVSAHFVDENFDTGDIIKVNYFEIDPKNETAYSLEKKSQEQLLKLFNEVIDMVAKGEELPRTPQKQEDGVTYTKVKTLKYETINKEDSEEMIDRKIRAFWFPPFSAKIEINGKNYSLVNQEIVNSIAK